MSKKLPEAIIGALKAYNEPIDSMTSIKWLPTKKELEVGYSYCN